MRGDPLPDQRRAGDGRYATARSAAAPTPRGRSPGRCFGSQRFLKDAPATYPSSAERGFCPICGTQISFTADFIPGLIDITIGSLDRPERLAPTLRCWDRVRLSWLHLADDLPKFPELPPVAWAQPGCPRLAKSQSSGGIRRARSGGVAKPMPGTWSEAQDSMPAVILRKTSSPRRS
jgi:Glutathione-dependent formaldehyde-activating enzyme